MLNMGLHAGTHLDSPYHFYSSGRKVIEIPLDDLMGPVKIIDVETNLIEHSSVSNPNSNLEILDPRPEIEASNFKNIKKGDIIVIKTGWSFKWGLDNYFTENPYLSEEAADFLVKMEIKGLAIDGPSVDPFGKTSCHKKLLFNDIWIVENLKNLELIPQLDNKCYNEDDNENNDSLEFFLIPLPLKSEASPVRAFARVNE